MDLPKNRFKQALTEGRQQIGMWCTIPGPVPAEALATCGYDWVLIDTEHSLTDIPDTMAMMQAMVGHGPSSLVRPAANDPVLIKRLLDLGAQTLLIPYVQTRAEAEAAVAAIRYAPRGIRGVSYMTRATGYGAVEGYLKRAETELCLLLQVETDTALTRIEEIASVDGVDGLFIGPSDLAASMGHPGEPGHPEVVAAIEAAIPRIVATGKAAGILATDLAFARRCMALGTTFTAVGVDLHLLVLAARKLSAEFRGA